MRRILFVLSLVLLCAVSLVGVSAQSPRSQNYAVPLSGGEEVPPADTKARGVAIFHVSHDGDSINYRLNVANIEDVLMAHIHLAPAGLNGGVVVWLYPDGPPPQLIPGRSNGTLATGTITSDDLTGALAGLEISDLLAEMESGNAYVNVHTDAFPGGEIRGQIR